MPLPVNVATCTITGKFTDVNGTPSVGTVTFVPTSKILLDGVSSTSLLGSPIIFTLDEDGEIPVGSTVPATDDLDLNPTGWAYKVLVHTTYYRPDPFFIYAPGGESVDLSEVVPIVDLDEVPIIASPVLDSWTVTAAAASEEEALLGVSNDTIMTPLRVHGRLPQLDVRSYGAVGNGVVNDTAALTSVVSAAVALGGGEIRIPQGKTILTDRLNLAAISVPLRFCGGGVLKLRVTNTALVQVDASTSPIRFDGIIFDGNGLVLTNNTCGVVRVTNSAETVTLVNCEVRNGGNSGIVTNTGGKISIYNCTVHTNVEDGILIQGDGKARITHNDIYNCGLGGVRVKHSTASSSLFDTKGVVISDNIISDIRDDIGGTGEYGNGIFVYRACGVAISNNVIRNVEFSFIRANDADHTSITGNVCDTAGEVGIFVELGSRWVSVVGNTVRNTTGSGIDMANADDGATGSVCSGNTVKGFGVSASSKKMGIHASSGQVVGNTIDGFGQAGAEWGIYSGKSSGTVTDSFHVNIGSNQITGCKYDVGHAQSHLSGVSQTFVSGIQHIPSAADSGFYLGPWGSGNPNTAAASIDWTTLGNSASRIFVSECDVNCPTAQTPVALMVGSRLRINNKWYTSDGVRWILDVPEITVYKTTIETVNNSDVLQNDNELLFSIGASETWVGTFVLFTSGNATADFKFELTAPVGATIRRSAFGQRLSDAVMEDDGAAPMVGGATTSEQRHTEIAFSITNSTTAGTVNLQWAQNTLTVADSSINAGSYVTAKRIA